MLDIGLTNVASKKTCMTAVFCSLASNMIYHMVLGRSHGTPVGCPCFEFDVLQLRNVIFQQTLYIIQCTYNSAYNRIKAQHTHKQPNMIAL